MVLSALCLLVSLARAGVFTGNPDVVLDLYAPGVQGWLQVDLTLVACSSEEIPLGPRWLPASGETVVHLEPEPDICGLLVKPMQPEAGEAMWLDGPEWVELIELQSGIVTARLVPVPGEEE